MTYRFFRSFPTDAAIKALLTLVMILHGNPVKAQVATNPAPASAARIQFLPRYDFHLTAEHISSSDRRYVWDTNFGGELDFVDYGFGRATFVANYQAILGEEIRAFDPNQGNYVLSGLVTARGHGIETAVVFYHQSRHLSDRAKQLPLDWNMVGGRLIKKAALGKNVVDTHVDLLRVVQKTTVDYRWEFDADAHGRKPLRSNVSVVGGANFRMLGVDGSRNRGTQHGYRADGGLRFDGKAGAIELFLAGERRIDPYPLEFGSIRWVSLGFRFLSH